MFCLLPLKSLIHGDRAALWITCSSETPWLQVMLTIIQSTDGIVRLQMSFNQQALAILQPFTLPLPSSFLQQQAPRSLTEPNQLQLPFLWWLRNIKWRKGVWLSLDNLWFNKRLQGENASLPFSVPLTTEIPVYGSRYNLVFMKWVVSWSRLEFP